MQRLLLNYVCQDFFLLFIYIEQSTYLLIASYLFRYVAVQSICAIKRDYATTQCVSAIKNPPIYHNILSYISR